MSRISFRKFQCGDEEAINDLYFAVTGRRRTIEQFQWQWLSAPAGRGEIWLIEYEEEGGGKRLIGHHGLMPLYFSNGSREMIAGKTENTMVLKEFRRKILYPKFERKFLEIYKNRFDILFSTMGPSAALRQRKSLGYTADTHWQIYEWGLHSAALLSKVYYSFSLRKDISFGMKSLATLFKGIFLTIKTLGVKRTKNIAPLKIKVLNSDDAKLHPFFDDFWEKCRPNYGMTPRRNREDIAWRFWNNPYGEYITLIIASDDQAQAYAVIRKRGDTQYSIEDLISTKPDPKQSQKIIEGIGKWVAEQGGMSLMFITCSDDIEMIEALNSVCFKNLLESMLYSRTQKQPQTMLRKVCQEKGVATDQDLFDWYVTQFVFEGR